MYWFRRPCVVYASYALLLSVMSCTGTGQVSDARTVTDSPAYFSLAKYFDSEAQRLHLRNRLVTKTVSKNGERESHAIRIGNWQNELALFIDSEINKPAWRASYRVDSLDDRITYTSLDSTLRTQRITVETKADGSVKRISVHNRVANMLYRSDERLDYHPDSLYRIDKHQRVRVIGTSRYTVSGVFN